jgi:hypothetical protein
MVMKISEFKKQIRENIVEILSEKTYAGPDAVEPAKKDPHYNKLNTATKTNIINTLKKGGEAELEEAELDEMARTAAKLTIADKETAEAIKEKFKGKWLEKMIDIIMDAGSEGISQPEVAKMLDKVQPAINPQVRALTASGVIKLTGAAPAEPKEKEPKVKAFKPKMAALAKDDTPEDVKDTYYDTDAEDVGFDRLGISDVVFWHDCFMLLGLVAQSTTRIELGPMVTNPYSRHPAVLAGIAATLHDVSGGRAFMGIGAGAGLPSMSVCL